MHITLRMNPGKGITVPIDYNHIVQGAIYHAIDPLLAERLHGQGYVVDGRVFRLFCFSRLTGAFNMDKQASTMTFVQDISLVIVSPITEFVQSLATGLLRSGNWRLGESKVEIKEIKARQWKVEQSRIIVRTLSPVTVYSTMQRPDGRKYTVYFQPGDPDYNAMITANLRKKYKACYGIEASEGLVRVCSRGNLKMNLLQYKGTVIKGYSGIIHLEGPQELLQMAVDGGLGSKNAQGFGCLEVK